MKILIIPMLLLSMSGCVTQAEYEATHKPIQPVEKIYEMPGLSQSQIYDGARQWFAQTFVKANAVIQYEDKSAGSIIGKGSMAYPCQTSFRCLGVATNTLSFTIRVDTKEGKMRVNYSDLIRKVPAAVTSGIHTQAMDINVVTEEDKILISNKLIGLTDDMAQKINSGEKTNSNW
jgi:hypothetical protein